MGKRQNEKNSQNGIRSLDYPKSTSKVLNDELTELDDFFENAAVGLHWVGPDGTILKANRYELELLGYTKDEYVGHNISEFHADQEVISCILDKLDKNQTLVDFPARLKGKDGSIKHVLITSNVYRKDGKFVHTRCFTRDITNENAISKALNDAELLKEAILASSDDCIKVLTLDANLEYMNPGGLRTIGVSDFNMIKGNCWFNFFQGESRTAAENVFKEALAGKTVHFMPETVANDGSRKFWSITARPIQNENGVVDRVLVTSRDVTDQRTAEKIRQEARVKITENKYRLIIESIKDYAICMLDPEGNVATWNEGAQRANGYSPEEIIGKHFSQFYLPEEKSTKPVQLLARAKTEGRVEDEGWRVRKDGSKFWANVVITSLYDEGKLIGFAKITRDLNERKTSEDDLRKAHEKVEDQAKRFDAALSASPDFYYLLDTDHRFTYVNRSLLNLWGKSLEEVVGKNFKDLNYPDELVRLHTGQLNEVLKGKTVKGENPYTNHEGKIGIYEYTFIPIFDSSGQVSSVAGTTRDVTVERELLQARLDEQRRAIELYEAERREKTLANERENFRNLFQQTPEMVCILNGQDHVFEFVNEAHIKVLGFDATGMSVREAQPESVEVHGILDGVYNSGKTAELNEIPVTVGKKRRYFNLTYSARHDDNGNINGVMILGTEVTSELQARKEIQKAKEEAVHANQLKTAFLANMSHEIRTPLGAMIGFADLLKDPGLSAVERSNYIDILTRNGENLNVIINDILDLSKVEAGHLLLEFKETNPEQVAAEVLSLLAVKAKEKDLSIDYEKVKGTPAKVVTDAVRVRQVLLNLIGNAIKFTKVGSVKRKSYKTVTEEGKSTICYEIKDTGLGIQKEKWERIFEMFVQADGSMSRRFGGTGIGLALSRKLARALGGDVKVIDSKINVGTTFLFTFEDQPLLRNTEETAQQVEPLQVESSGKALLNVKILVVDDSPDNQKLIWHYIKGQGGLVETADNGMLGYKKALAGDFDLILMDIQMPEMDGYTATSKLREAGYPKPIIALTAHVLSDVRQKCLQVGCSAHLAKPINQKQLISTIVGLIQKDTGPK